jgi:molecular chaperone HtpG
VLEAAGAALAPLGCDVVARSFDPPSLPALYLLSRAAIQAGEMREARDAATGFWSGILDAVGGPAGEAPPQRPQLMLNLRSPVVGRITQLAEPGLVALAIQALYGQALLQGHHPLRPDDSALLNRSFLGLLDWAMRPGGASRGAR